MKVFILEPSLQGHGGNFTKILSQAFCQKQEVSIAVYANEFNLFFIRNYLEKTKINHVLFLTDLMQKLHFPNVINKFVFLLYIITKFSPDILILPSIDGMIYLIPFFRPLIWLLGYKTKIYGFLASYKYYYIPISFLKKRLFEIGLSCIDKVLINDIFFAEYLTKAGFKTIQYMPDPVENFCLNTDIKQLKLKWNFPSSSYLVGMTGAIDSRKGADRIIHASSQIKREDIYFILAGKMSDEIRQLLKTDKSSSNLIIIDKFLSLEEMHEIITCLDLILLPYRKSHFGIASMLLRAMACHRPALVTKYGWLEKMSEKYDGIHSFEGEQDFLDKINDVESIIDNNKNTKHNAINNSIQDFISAWI